jgi:hypothetical protein
MSAIDLFACTMGAFVLLTLILLPYYLKVDRSYKDLAGQLQLDLASLQVEADRADDLLLSCTSDLTESVAAGEEQQRQLQSSLQHCEAIKRRDFLLITMSWDTTDDVDLHVVDPRGRRYYYSDKVHEGSRASLELDTVTGPGNEIWLLPDSDPGEYKIYFNLFTKKQNAKPVEVWGKVHSQQRAVDLPTIVLTEQLAQSHDVAPLIATVTVGGDGTIDVVQ